jgi:putative membrane protein
MSVRLLAALAGALVATPLALVPALHVYNVAALALILAPAAGASIPPEQLAFFFIGLITAYAMLNALPAIFLSAPDEATVFIVLPGQKYLLQRRGYEAAALTGLGGLGGLAVLTVMTPLAPRVLPTLRAILRPHLHWLLWTVIAFMLLSEWPKGAERAPAGWRRWWAGWRSLTAGLATFLLSGLMGMILLYRSPLPVRVAYQTLMPAFVGLFAVPWVLQNLAARVKIPPQHVARTVDATPELWVRGTLAGALGGAFAAYFPVVTGGIGGLIAGHATAQRDDRLFLIAQGASKVLYYAGGFLLFFVPGLHLTRGGMAWMVSSLWTARTPRLYYLAVAAVLLTGTLSFFTLLGLARLTIHLIRRVPYQAVSGVTLLLLLGLVAGLTGGNGLLVCAVATGIGLLPVLWGSRRMNAMGVLLLPIALNMSGVGAVVAGWLGLL